MVLPSWIKPIKGSGRSWVGEINFLHSSVQCRCSRDCTVSDSFCGHLFNDETIMWYITHWGILFSNSLLLVPRNMNNEAFSREAEVLPETHHKGRTCCWLMLWIIVGVWGGIIGLNFCSPLELNPKLFQQVQIRFLPLFDSHKSSVLLCSSWWCLFPSAWGFRCEWQCVADAKVEPCPTKPSKLRQ